MASIGQPTNPSQVQQPDPGQSTKVSSDQSTTILYPPDSHGTGWNPPQNSLRALASMVHGQFQQKMEDASAARSNAFDRLLEPLNGNDDDGLVDAIAARIQQKKAAEQLQQGTRGRSMRPAPVPDTSIATQTVASANVEETNQGATGVQSKSTGKVGNQSARLQSKTCNNVRSAERALSDKKVGQVVLSKKAIFDLVNKIQTVIPLGIPKKGKKTTVEFDPIARDVTYTTPRRNLHGVGDDHEQSFAFGRTNGKLTLRVDGSELEPSDTESRYSADFAKQNITVGYVVGGRSLTFNTLKNIASVRVTDNGVVLTKKK